MSTGIFKNTLLNLIAFIPIDAKLNEGHRPTVTPTSFALEDGAVVTDHAILNPDVLEIDFLITNQDVPHTSIASSYGIRSISLFQLFLAMIHKRSLHTIVTKHNIYPNMLLIEAPMDHSAPFSGSLTGKAKFQQISKARLFNVSITVDQLASDIAFQAANDTSFGNTATTTLDTASEFYNDLLSTVGL